MWFFGIPCTSAGEQTFAYEIPQSVSNDGSEVRWRELAINYGLAHGDVALAVEVMKAGAADFLEKPFDDEVILSAIRSALGRSRDIGSRAAERGEISQRLVLLSQRERQVLDGLVAGLPNKTIAYDLGISPRTVEVYRANMMTKMEANSLSELVRMVVISSGH